MNEYLFYILGIFTGFGILWFCDGWELAIKKRLVKNMDSIKLRRLLALPVALLSPVVGIEMTRLMFWVAGHVWDPSMGLEGGVIGLLVGLGVGAVSVVSTLPILRK
jgi:hypothetical protein